MRGNSPSAPCAQIFAFADARYAEPDRHVFGAVRHQQANGLALGEAVCARPARIAVGALGKLAVAQVLAGRKQGRRVAEFLRELLDHDGEYPGRMLGDRRRHPERAQGAPEEGDVALQSRDQPHAFPRQAVGACFGAPFGRALSGRADSVASTARKGYRVWLGPSSILLPPPLRGRDGERGGCLILGAATPLPVRACQVGNIRLGMREPTSPTRAR